MATLIRPDGTQEEVKPKRGRRYTLEELQGYVGGYIELVRLPDDRLMVINEDGKRLQLPVNHAATEMAGRRISRHDMVVGNALVVKSWEID